MPNYEDSKIYKIVNPENNLVYYGHTTATLQHRFNEHKRHNGIGTACHKLFISGTQNIELVEIYPCNKRSDIILRERFYIENNDCVNFVIPGRTKKEWIKDNREHVAEVSKKLYEKHKANGTTYYDRHKKILLEKNKKIINCYCGSKITFNSSARHERTNKHKNYIDSLHSSIY